MSAQTIEMGLRYNQLRADGTPGEEATGIINKEFGTNLSYAAIRSYGSLAKKRPEGLEQRSVGKEHKKDQTPGRSKEPEPILPQALDERIKTLAREVFEAMLHNVPNGRNIIEDTQDMPPEPELVRGEGKGRRENRAYTKASITIDLTLWDKLMEEKDRMRVSTGRMMDIVLWRYFNRPPLSFQLPESERSALEIKYPKPAKKQ